MCSEPISGKKRKLEDTNVEDFEEDGGTSSVQVHCPLEFKPICVISSWVEPGTTHRMLSVCINLPSGVSPKDVKVHVVDGGRELEISAQWPNVMSDLASLHRKWLKGSSGEGIQMYHPRITGFEKVYKSLQEKDSSAITSTCRIGLPFVVESRVYGVHNLGWVDNNTLVKYVDLRSYEDNFNITNDENSVEYY